MTIVFILELKLQFLPNLITHAMPLIIFSHIGRFDRSNALFIPKGHLLCV